MENVSRKPKSDSKVIEGLPAEGLPAEGLPTQGLPTLISFNEFLFSIRKMNSYYIETLGGFAYWLKRTKGIARKASEQYWKSCFAEFLERKL